MTIMVLVTGATGFIGTQITRQLLQNDQVNVLSLVRAADKENAIRKLEREWWDWPELIQALNTRIEVVCGDVCQPNLGLTEDAYGKLAKKITHVVHTVADWRFLPLEELRKTNVQGTANVLLLAKKANADHGIERFSHISTAYVAGGRTGTVPEDVLTDEYGFFTAYEQSKYEGEMLVQAAKEELPISIFRPAMVVGDSQTGAIKTFNTFYFPLRLYLTGKLRILPVSRSLRINIVPVDYVATSVVKLTFNPQAEGLNFHLVAPYKSLPKLGELLEFVEKWAETNLGIKLPRFFAFGMSTSSMKRLLQIQKAIKPSDRKSVEALISLSPYFSENRQFQRRNLDELVGTYDMNWRATLPHLLEYAVYHGFFHRSERTVHEQVLYRLESKSFPITYYDIIEDKIVKKTADQVLEEILSAAAALRSMGISVGDRVALTGLNSSDYLAAEVAIGLVGAISVPLYYTTPPI